MQSSLLVLICLESWCGLGACRACHDKAKFTENGFHMRLLLRFRYWRFCRFIRAGDLSLPLLCKISIACLPFSKVAFVVIFPTKLVLFHSDVNCKSSGIFGLQMGAFTFPHLSLYYILGLWCFSAYSCCARCDDSNESKFIENGVRMRKILQFYLGVFFNRKLKKRKKGLPGRGRPKAESFGWCPGQLSPARPA